MINIEIRCPKCSKIRNLIIDQVQIKFKPSGLCSINIEENFTCNHSYVVYIDQHYEVRDYFDFDYEIDLPDIIPVNEIEEIIVKSSISDDFHLIKINLTANIITIILKAIISKKPILFIKDKNIYYDNLIPFFEEITNNLFEFKIELISREDYQSSKLNYKKNIVLDTSTIINNPYKFIDVKKLKVEKRIINIFINELDISVGIKKLKNHLKNAYNLAVIIYRYIENQKKKKNIYAKNIVDYLKSSHNIIISSQYLDFLIEIVNQYFKIPVKLSIPHYTGVF